MRKEYGGYLPLELRKGKEYYKGQDCVALNSGRYAIRYALWDAARREPVKKVWLPYYICPTVEEALRQQEETPVQIGFYHVDKELLPMEVQPVEGEYLVWVNYFGMQTQETVRRMAERYPRLIVDNTQGFFTEPVDDVYNVYSCRKFLGVPDGAYVLRRGIRHRQLPTDASGSRAAHLLISLEEGTNAAYGQNKENEAGLDRAGMRQMSPLTRAILEGADYAYIKEKRLENARQLHRLLGGKNRLRVNTDTVLMSYPFACEQGDALRAYLVEQRVYAAKLWKEVSANPLASDWERELSDSVCILPVDQRYDAADMEEIAAIVKRFLA